MHLYYSVWVLKKNVFNYKASKQMLERKNITCKYLSQGIQKLLIIFRLLI